MSGLKKAGLRGELRGISVLLVPSRAMGDTHQEVQVHQRIQQLPGFKDAAVWLELGCFS